MTIKIVVIIIIIINIEIINNVYEIYEGLCKKIYTRIWNSFQYYYETRNLKILLCKFLCIFVGSYLYFL